MREWHYADRSVALRQGDEVGRFRLGSTVVMLFPIGMLRVRADWVQACAVRVGEAMTES